MQKDNGQGREVDVSGIASTAGDIAWDELHCDPRAEVVLVSSDGVGFRVGSWYMREKR